MTSRLRIPAWLALAALLASVPAAADSKFGDQRVGTSSGTFLEIGIGARAVGMGEAFVAVANDPSAIFWNPAGLASLQRKEAQVSHIQWPADIRFEHGVAVIPVRKFGGSIGVQFGVLATEMDETTELAPFGTGRTFFYSDVVAGVAYARRWTDKLLIGAGIKYVREDLGSDVGGPVTQAALVDIGSIYYLGLGSVRIATALSNFGPEMKPSGNWTSPNTGEVRTFDGFDPPLLFRYGVAFEPIERPNQRLTASFEANQPADDAQIFKLGAEWRWANRLSLRTGYNFNADEMRLSAGAGLYAQIGSAEATVDYAYTAAGALGSVNRLSLGVRF